MKLRELREKNKLSQQDLARILKVSPSTISNWESEKRQPDIEMVIVIADYFDVSVDEVLGRTSGKTIRRDDGSDHSLECDEVREITNKLKTIDQSFLPALELIIDGLNKKSNQN